LVRVLVLLAVSVAVSGCMSTTRNAADAFYGSLFPTANAPIESGR
jgi:hypothetical protein